MKRLQKDNSKLISKLNNNIMTESACDVSWSWYTASFMRSVSLSAARVKYFSANQEILMKKVVSFLDFPIIHTNFWDAVIAVPIILIVTQIIKIFLKVPKKYVPSIAIALGLIISVCISHRHSLIAGVFMGGFYGYAAIGSYASLKTTISSYRNKKA